MDEPGTLISVLIQWFPMILVFGAWIYFMRRQTNPVKGISHAQYLEQLLAEERRHNDVLEKLLQRLAEKQGA
ncbi:MAG: hypothetical protein ABL893_12435 [Hyphomicrobium sp.]|nr:hypothetical protein [Hyphomicrobium sp.]